MKSLKKRFAALATAGAVAALSLLAVATPASADDPPPVSATLTGTPQASCSEPTPDLRLFEFFGLQLTPENLPSGEELVVHAVATGPETVSWDAPGFTAPTEIQTHQEFPLGDVPDGEYTLLLTVLYNGDPLPGVESMASVTCGTPVPPTPSVEGATFSSTTCEAVDYTVTASVPDGSSLPVFVDINYGAEVTLTSVELGQYGLISMTGSVAAAPGVYELGAVIRGSSVGSPTTTTVTVAECSTATPPSGGGEEPQKPPVVNVVPGASTDVPATPSLTAQEWWYIGGTAGVALLLVGSLVAWRRKAFAAK